MTDTYQWELLVDGEEKEAFDSVDKNDLHALLVEAQFYVDDANQGVNIHVKPDRNDRAQDTGIDQEADADE